MKITFYRAFPDPYRQSMTAYADLLQKYLRGILSPDQVISNFIPHPVFLKPRLLRHFSQYLLYQVQAPPHQGDINHIVDHSYGHLIHGLDAGKSVVTFHDAIGLLSRNGNGNFDSNKVTGMRKVNLNGIRKAARVICVSEASRRSFLKITDYPGDRIRIVPQGIESVFFEDSKQDPAAHFDLPPGFYLLHVGHTQFYKNVPALFRVLSVLKKEGKDVRLLKVGTDFTPEQKQLLKECEVEDRIVHLGLISRDQLPLAYRAANVLLFPSLNEGFGFPVLEAMASGLPVIASNRGSIPEVAGEAALLTEADDIAGMADAVKAVMDDSGLRQGLIEKGKMRAKSYTWQRTAEQTLAVYREICGMST